MHPVRRAVPLALLVLGTLSLGACGTSPLAKLDLGTRHLSDRECLARVMYFESNRSSEDGMLAVGTVVMNRLQDRRYPKTVCGVVGQPGQFAEGALTKPVVPRLMARVERVADEVLDGKRHSRVAAAMHFHTVGMTFPYRNMHYVVLAGGNAFYEKRTPGTFVPSTPAERGIVATTQFAAATPRVRPAPVEIAEAPLAFRRPVVLAAAPEPLASRREASAPVRIAAVLPLRGPGPAATVTSRDVRPSVASPPMRLAALAPSKSVARLSSPEPVRAAGSALARASVTTSTIAKSPPVLAPKPGAAKAASGMSVVAKTASPPARDVLPIARPKSIIVAMVSERRGPSSSRGGGRDEPEMRRR